MAGDVSGFQKNQLPGHQRVDQGRNEAGPESVESFFVTEKHGNKTAVLMITVCVWNSWRFSFCGCSVVDVVVFLF